jgi:hypothetical protein
MTEVIYHFEEMQLSGEGLMAAGKATLESDRADDSEFFVSEIVLNGGQRLTLPSRINTGNVFNDTLFKAIASQIEDERTTHGKHAALEWSDAVSGNIPASVPSPVNVFARLEGHFAGVRS